MEKKKTFTHRILSVSREAIILVHMMFIYFFTKNPGITLIIKNINLFADINVTAFCFLSDLKAI